MINNDTQQISDNSTPMDSGSTQPLDSTTDNQLNNEDNIAGESLYQWDQQIPESRKAKFQSPSDLAKAYLEIEQNSIPPKNGRYVEGANKNSVIASDYVVAMQQIMSKANLSKAQGANLLHQVEELESAKLSYNCKKLSEIFYSDIKQIISTSQPVQMLIAIKIDSTFAMYTYQADLQGAAWTNHKLGGQGHILSACSIFDKKSLGDVIYFSVLRHKKRSKVDAMKLKHERSKKSCEYAKKQREELDKTRNVTNMEKAVVGAQTLTSAKNLEQTNLAFSSKSSAKPMDQSSSYSQVLQGIQKEGLFKLNESEDPGYILDNKNLTSPNNETTMQTDFSSPLEGMIELEDLFKLEGDEYFRYILDEGNVIDELTLKLYDQWTCIVPELKKNTSD